MPNKALPSFSFFALSQNGTLRKMFKQLGVSRPLVDLKSGIDL